MLDVVGWTFDDAWPQLNKIYWEAEQRPEEFCAQQSSTMRLQSSGWVEREGKLNAKYARVQSHKVDIATLMIYPTASPDLLPVFAVDWVVVGSRCQIGVLDVQMAGEQTSLKQELASRFQPLAGRWQSEFCEKPTHVQAWFDSLATPWALVVACSNDSLPKLRQAFGEYLRAAIADVYLPRLPAAQGGWDAEEVAEYKCYHYAHFPGRKMMDNAFGADFTERFLTDWHFGKVPFAHRKRISTTRQRFS